MEDKPNTATLQSYISPVGAWAFGIGTAVGWGSFVITSNTYLAQAGPLGTVLGVLVGAVIMLIISRNFHFMTERCPDCGGVYSYTKTAFGHDYGFMTAWFLILTYFSMLWANATSLPLFARYFFGDIFQFGRLYTIFGYEVYLGEALLSIAFVVLIAALCLNLRRLTERLMIGMGVIFTLGIVVCFFAAIFRHTEAGFMMQPVFAESSGKLSQVIRIAAISPWAFIGFESIAHSAGEYTFPHKKTFRVLLWIIISTTALYILVCLLSVTAYPPEYDSWRAYIADLGNLSGLKALPGFYAANTYMGTFGVVLLTAALMCLILTSLIGNIVALSRLLYALAEDGVLPAKLKKVNKHHVPSACIGVIVAVSVLIPFLGRTAIGWIVDVTTLGATIIYGFVSAAVIKVARQEGLRHERVTGWIGAVIMGAFLLMLLLPNLFGSGTMASESYFLFTIWAVLGFLFFHRLLRRDRTRRFGRSLVVWIAMLSLILFTSLIWMEQSTERVTDDALTQIREHYETLLDSEEDAEQNRAFMAAELDSIQTASTRNTVVVFGIFLVALAVLMSNYTIMRKREEASHHALGVARDIAYTDAMTGVKNKRAYTEEEEIINERIAEGTSAHFAVVVCDVNGLKRINDTLGHKAGDEYIREACRMICSTFKHSPVYRVGGDEFVAVLRGDDYDARDALYRQLDDKSVSHIGTDHAIVAGGMSVFHSGEDGSFQDVFQRADDRMYVRKKELKEIAVR